MCYVWAEKNQFGPAAFIGTSSSNNLASGFASARDAVVSPPTGSAGEQTCDLGAIGVGIPRSFPILPNNWPVNEHAARRANVPPSIVDVQRSCWSLHAA